jgi:hypothetical protein
MGLKEAWANECKKAYDAKDWNLLWKIMYAATLAGATGGPFAVAPNASFFLRRFLDKGGDLKLDYTFDPLGQGNWLRSPSVRNGISALDTDAKHNCLASAHSGTESGIYENSRRVDQGAASDGDCYYAIGKFILNGKFKFSTLSWFGKRHLKIERIYWIREAYDWTPGATGGILPHDYPIALQNNGLAAVYTYELIFGESEYKIPY